jgi:hypothetical protein
MAAAGLNCARLGRAMTPVRPHTNSSLFAYCCAKMMDAFLLRLVVPTSMIKKCERSIA